MGVQLYVDFDVDVHKWACNYMSILTWMLARGCATIC